MRLGLRVRLSAMMFLQFFIWGAWYVTAPRYLGAIGFTGDDIGWTYSAGPIAAIVSPLFVGIVADRFVAVQRVLGVLHLAAAGLMLLAAQLMTAADPSPAAINAALLGYMLCYFPTIALTNTLALRNIDNAEQQFPSIRVLGTIGWIAAGNALLWGGIDDDVGMFHLAAAVSAGMGLYSFTLPHTPPALRGAPVDIKALLGLDALVMLKRADFGLFMLSSFLVCIPLAFYYQLAARAVEAGGVADVARTMTYGQMSEIAFMLVMPWFFSRLGVKWMLLVGMLAWAARYVLLALGVPDQVAWMVLGGIVLHGICYDFFFVTGQIYTDNAAPPQIRGQAQALLVLCTLGFGMLAGAQIAGAVESAHTPPAARALQTQVEARSAELTAARAQLGERAPSPAEQEQLAALEAELNDLTQQRLRAMEWRPIWLYPAFAAAAVAVLFALLFRSKARGRGELEQRASAATT